jgi:hypothetical protein
LAEKSGNAFGGTPQLLNPFLKEVETRRIIENNFLKRGMLCSLKGFVEKVFLECESLLERSGNPALRGFRGFKA